ncbi:MAG: hypothetical protein R8L07_02590 [Alphaproteobacteria bacterium]|nr:hypothetical protein [Alphaproteobacteria bacterium]
MQGHGGGMRAMLDRAVGPYLWRPWYDRVATPAVAKVFFPLSRAWAAALAAEGDPDRFLVELDDGPPRRTVGAGLLGLIQSAALAHETARAAWENAFFGHGRGDLAYRERARLRAARKLMALRAAFLPGHLERAFASVRFGIEDEASVASRHAARLDSPDGLAMPDLDLPVRESRRVMLDGAYCSWLRFDPPVEFQSDAPVEARLRVPAADASRGTVIFAHGIGMEGEFWGDRGGVTDWYLSHGFRVVEPQGPWHAYRRRAGYYGGEPILARGPAGLLDYSWCHLRELGRLIAWAKFSGDGPVMLSGISLGALTSMQLLSWARFWPEAAKPDYALLIAPAASLTEVTYRGSLSGGLGVPDALREAGWDEEMGARWAPLLDAGERPGIDPDRILCVLGDADAITPIASGRELVTRWGLPAENVFSRPQGHFSVSLGLTAAPEPLVRGLTLMSR